MDSTYSSRLINGFFKLIRQIDSGSGKTPLFPRAANAMLSFLYPMFITVICLYLSVGICTGIWHPTWVIVLIIPFYVMLNGALYMKSKKSFLLLLPLPILATAAFILVRSFYKGLENTWLIWLVLPIYYWAITAYMKGGDGNHEG